MKYTTLPTTDIEVSKICLGTMTWGRQNTEAEGHAQMDLALEKGVNFFDTAEMYPIPPTEEISGDTERIIGTWFKKTGNRQKIVLATKIVGPAPNTQHIRTNGFAPDAIVEAVEGSLKRLQTDYIDLYQLHWPERNANFFGKRGYVQKDEDWEDNIAEVLETLDALVKAGKIRHVGLSNETPWGTMRFLEEAKSNTYPRPITIQNPYSLLNRLFEVGLAEIAHRENIGLIPYSPMAFGTLSGKYRNGNMPEKGRLTLFPQYARYSSTASVQATEAYCALAEAHGLRPAQMALAFVNTRPFVTSNIIGATTLEQLKENIASIDVALSEAVLEGIEAIHNQFPNPAP